MLYCAGNGTRGASGGAACPLAIDPARMHPERGRRIAGGGAQARRPASLTVRDGRMDGMQHVALSSAGSVPLPEPGDGVQGDLPQGDLTVRTIAMPADTNA